MSMLESIEKLRKLTICDKGEKYTAYLDAGDIADEIEREITEKYMKLPVDADGVPIHIGDRLSHANNREFVVNGITFYHNTWRVVTDLATLDDGFQMRWAKECRHVKTRTVEDVLERFVSEMAESKLTVDGSRKVIAKYAAELRIAGDSE